MGLLAFIIYAMCVIALSWLLFTSAASAVSVGGRPYRGYADVCLAGGSCRPMQTHALFDTREECELTLSRVLSEYRAQQLALGNAILWQMSCRYDPRTYDA